MATGLVRRVTDGSGYLLGGRVLDLTRRYLDNDLLVMNFLDAAGVFAEETGQTVHLSRLDGQDVVLLARKHGPRGLQGASSVGARFPAFSSGVGKAMLSLLTDENVGEIYQGVDQLPVKTRQALRTVDQLIEHLQNVRDMGYAIDDEESQVGLRCYGISLFKLSGMCFGISTTITATGHSRADEDKFLRMLTSLRDELVSGSSDGAFVADGE
jgi:DNA-binding IclR family transcriptional regulator